MRAPLQDEYAAYAESYVSLARQRDPFTLLRNQVSRLVRVCGGMSEEGGRHRYAPGKWSVKENIGHVADTERVLSYRLLRLARGDSTPLPGFEQDPYVSAGMFDNRPLGELVEEFRAVRAATLTLIDSLPEAAWSAEGTANGARITARALLFMIPGHVEHHFEGLAGRYALEGLRE